MSDLSPDAKSLLDSARSGDEPTSADDARTQRALAAQLGVGLAIAASTTASTTAAAAGAAGATGVGAASVGAAGAAGAGAAGAGAALVGASSTGILLAKVLAGVALVGGISAGGASLYRSRNVQAPLMRQSKRSGTGDRLRIGRMREFLTAQPAR